MLIERKISVCHFLSILSKIISIILFRILENYVAETETFILKFAKKEEQSGAAIMILKREI